MADAEGGLLRQLINGLMLVVSARMRELWLMGSLSLFYNAGSVMSLVTPRILKIQKHLLAVVDIGIS